ncbi:MAG: ABC transporter ATP-binding protein [Clostridium sp.]|jgi:lipoprotein-releasing system ATP-binding protein lolD 2|uniref:ABC transporter ATP-binding protein n=1 Tax=Clostridium sp. TaxID=1506 RepID=UPI0025BE8E98|nr:ABC transporter ATP-binding protein [Clostridium sp.]MCI6691464.1 ABC transporter ATP-binding protein [Clostridium sp.]MDY2632194.1 ABC transporter ATP-binding protein [Clostridium sp.]
MAKIVSLNNINKYFGNVVKTQVLHDVNLSFEEGTFNSIIGASGSGKSTLLNLIGTLDKPSTGEVYINSRRTDTLKKNELAELRNETIGFIFQFHYLLPEFTALENVLMPYKIKSSKVSKEVIQRAEYLLDLVGLSKVKNNLAVNMSGGQQQRTAIARALMNNPKIILADEPTGNLDSESSETIYNIMRDINKKFNTTFIIITHDDRIAQKADRIIEIKDGRIIQDKIVNEIIEAIDKKIRTA